MKKMILLLIGVLVNLPLQAEGLLFLKGTQLFRIIDGVNYTYITSQVTRLIPGTKLFLKNDRLFRLSEGEDGYEYLTQGVSDVCEGGRYLIKQGKLYLLIGGETEYITSGVTACR